CTEYRQKKCGLAHCPYLKEKIEAGAVDYKTLVEDCFAGNKNIAFGRRLTFVYERRKPSLYKNAEHRDRFTLAKSAKDMRRCNTPPHILAALFLLTASFSLWSRCETAITNRGICFEKVNLRGIAMNDYIVFQAAKTIYTGKESITISDLGDRTVVEDAEFYVIIAACLLAKYGADLLSLEETFREDLSKWYE
ncbi:MAG: hypothetical protein RR865_14040, partial [Clostridia bacterium]